MWESRVMFFYHCILYTVEITEPQIAIISSARVLNWNVESKGFISLGSFYFLLFLIDYYAYFKWWRSKFEISCIIFFDTSKKYLSSKSYFQSTSKSYFQRFYKIFNSRIFCFTLKFFASSVIHGGVSPCKNILVKWRYEII